MEFQPPHPEHADRVSIRKLEGPEPIGSAFLPPGEPKGGKFYLEPFEDIKIVAGEEWLVKCVLPRHGVAVIYGKSQSFKSFVALDLGFRVAAGWAWAGLKVMQASVIYIAAEGAVGVRKRKVGWTLQNPNIPSPCPFRLISAAPNLGSADGDLPALIESVEAEGIAPGVIFIDTLAQTLGGADENGAGMIQYVANAQALSKRFGCLVVIIHHVGLSDEERLRGHSSLHGAIDAQILCERASGTLTTGLKIQKLKDEDAGRTFSATLSRVVIGHDEDGDEVSTLVVDSVIEQMDARGGKPKSARIPKQQRLLMDVIEFMITECGFDFRPYPDGPSVRAVSDNLVRREYLTRLADTEAPTEAQKKAFRRSINAIIEGRLVGAAEQRGERVIWIL